MKNFLRIVAFLLAFLMVSSVFVACGEKPEENEGEETTASVETEKETDEDDDEVTQASAEATSEAATTEAATEAEYSNVSKLQGNFEGADYRISGSFHNAFDDDFEVDYEEIPEDVVGKAVWDRNVAIEEKYGLEIVGTLQDTVSPSVFINAGDDMYDLIIIKNNLLLGYATSGELVNINTLPHINFDMDCWNRSINDQLTYGNKMYYTTSKFLLEEKHRTWMVWYNRDLAQQLNVGYLEDEVFAGTWTMDRVIEISRSVSANTDGKEGMTDADRWGFVGSNPHNFGQLAYGAGFRLSDKGSDGYPRLVGPTDEMHSILDKIFELSANRNISYFSEYRPDGEEVLSYGQYIFLDGRAVLMGYCVSLLDGLGNLDFTCGALPNPKFNEAQESYISVPAWMHSHLFAVPATVSDIEKAGFGLQAISEESVATSYNAYIEERCKKQGSYDLDMARCLGIIFDNVAWDIAFIDDIGGLGQIMLKDLVASGSNTFTRMYNSKQRRATTQLKHIKEKYEAHDAT